jgi:hypothetical protein
MRRRQPESGEDEVRHARSKLRALAALAKQLQAKNVFRLSKYVLGQIRLALRDVLHREENDDRMAQLLGVVVMAAPGYDTEVPADLAESLRDDFRDLLREDALPEPD